MEAHGEDLRALSGDDELASDVKQDFRLGTLTVVQRALCEFAEKLTLRPWDMAREDIDRLRTAGLDDRLILDAVQVIAYFNHINRVADALGVDPEPEMKR
ncbi:MAG TPA: peroxidase-related enzyme [Acidobacteriota bacterium]|nr:peroxidase-related enzyme [Acidobacteriota bacterium]